jgi:hypothetical protein
VRENSSPVNSIKPDVECKDGMTGSIFFDSAWTFGSQAIAQEESLPCKHADRRVEGGQAAGASGPCVFVGYESGTVSCFDLRSSR